MSNCINSSTLSATAVEFSPGQTAHPSPAPSEDLTSPSPSQSFLNSQPQYQPQYQLQPQPQQYCIQQLTYGYQPYPIFNGYKQAYDFSATSPTCYAQPQGPAWTPEQNVYVGYTVDPYEPFAVQLNELQGIRSGQIPHQQNTWNNYGNGVGMNINVGNGGAHKKKAKKNKRRKFNSNKGRDRIEEHKVGEQTEVEAKVEPEETNVERKVEVNLEEQD